MLIKQFETFAVDAGSNTCHFLKVITDDGAHGWSEFGDGRPLAGVLAPLIKTLSQRVIGSDPRRSGRITTDLMAATRSAHPGLVRQAIAAIENACLDVSARSMGVPVHALFGGALRDRIPLYWSQCGMRRVMRPEEAARLGEPPLRSLADVEALGAEVRTRGYRALKAKIMHFDAQGKGFVHMPGFGAVGAGPALNLTRPLMRSIDDLLAAFRKGAGPDVDLIIDLNFNFRADGMLALARALEPHDLRWAEADIVDARALRAMRQGSRTPIGSLECVLGRRALLPYLEQRSVDVVIVDAMWNGLSESLAMAAMADACDLPVASHNYTGPLAALMSAHFSALIPNLTIMEYEVEGAPWRDSLLTSPVVVEDGSLVLPSGAGWGAEPDEAALTRYAVAA